MSINLPEDGAVVGGEQADEDAHEHDDDEQLLEDPEVLHRPSALLRIVRMVRGQITFSESDLHVLLLLRREAFVVRLTQKLC